MSEAATTFIPSFHPQRLAGAAPLSSIALASRLLELARKADRDGRPQVAGFLVGVALRQVRRPSASRQAPQVGSDLAECSFHGAPCAAAPKAVPAGAEPGGGVAAQG